MVDLSYTNIQNTNNLIINTQKETEKYEDTLKKLGNIAENVFKGISGGVAAAAESIGTMGYNALDSCDEFKSIAELTEKLPDLFSSGQYAAINCGEELISGISKGISVETPLFLSRVENWCANITDGIKEFFGIHSPSRVMRDEVGRYIALGMAAGITENSKEVSEAFKGMLSMLDYRRRLDLINDEEYYECLEELRDRYFAVGTKEWIEYTEKIYTYQKNRLEQMKKSYQSACNDVYDYTSKKLDEVIKKQEDYSDKLKKFGKLFKTVTISLDEGDISYYSLADLKKETEEIKRYSEMLSSQRARLLSAGIDEVTADSFFNEIASLSVEEGIKSLEALERADEKSLTQYITAYGEKLRLSDKISSEAYRSEFDRAVAESEEYMVQKLTEAGFEIPPSFFDTGTLAARNFGEAFASELDKELEKIKIKIDDFNAKLSLKTESAVGAAVSQVYNTYKDYQSIYNINSDSGDMYNEIKKYDTMRRMLGY